MTEPQQTTWKGASLALLLLALLFVLVVAPLAVLIGDALPKSSAELNALRELLQAPQLQQALLRTLAVALLACGTASVIAIPVAFVAVRSGPVTRTLISILGFLPLTMPPFVAAAMLDRFAVVFNETVLASSLGELHVRGSDIALSLVFAAHFLPLILFSLMAGLSRIDRAYAETAHTLGAGRLTVWGRITLPLATPAYAAGAALMLLKILEDLGAPLMLGVDQMLAPQIMLRLDGTGFSDPFLSVGALLLFGVSLVIAALAWSALLPSLEASGTTQDHPVRWRAGTAGGLAAAPVAIGLGVLTLAPQLWLVLTSLGTSWSDDLLPDGYSMVHYWQLSTETLPHLGTTLGYAAGVGILTLLIGGASGALTVRPGVVARLTRFVATGMFAIPGVVLALAYARMQDLIGFAPARWTGFGWLALSLVVALKQLPFAQRLVAQALRTLRHGELESARNLGATRLEAWLRIGLPALIGMIAGVFALGFAAATMELSAVLLLIEDPHAPLTLSMFRTLRTPATMGLGAAQGIVLVGLAASGLLMAHALLRRRTRAPSAIASDGHNTREKL